MSDLELEAYLKGFVEGFESGWENAVPRENMEPWLGKCKTGE